jgi:hypothetical protein
MLTPGVAEGETLQELALPLQPHALAGQSEAHGTEGMIPPGVWLHASGGPMTRKVAVKQEAPPQLSGVLEASTHAGAGASIGGVASIDAAASPDMDASLDDDASSCCTTSGPLASSGPVCVAPPSSTAGSAVAPPHAQSEKGSATARRSASAARLCLIPRSR